MSFTKDSFYELSEILTSEVLYGTSLKGITYLSACSPDSSRESKKLKQRKQGAHIIGSLPLKLQANQSGQS